LIEALIFPLGASSFLIVSIELAFVIVVKMVRKVVSMGKKIAFIVS